MIRVSVVIPTLNESACIQEAVRHLVPLVDEVVVSDGGSEDRTLQLAGDAGARVVVGPRGRGPQLDLGARSATHDRLWFLHADTRVSRGAGDALRRAAGPWGCFSTRIESQDPRLLWTAVWMNVRARHTGACSGDMGIWADRAFFRDVGGFGTLALEDLAFADRARRQHRCQVLAPAIHTSARRWNREGVTRTILRFWMLRLGYRVGVDPERLDHSYRSQPR